MLHAGKTAAQTQLEVDAAGWALTSLTIKRGVREWMLSCVWQGFAGKVPSFHLMNVFLSRRQFLSQGATLIGLSGAARLAHAQGRAPGSFTPTAPETTTGANQVSRGATPPVSAMEDAYDLDPQWPALTPEVYPEKCQISGVAVAADGSILALNHGENHVDPQTGFLKQIIRKPTVLVLDARTGRLKESWGAGLFMLPHQISVDVSGNVWVVDSGLKRVFKFNAEGALLMQLGAEGSGFTLPTDVAVLGDGSVVVADGTINRRGFRFNENGKLIEPWGLRGKGAMQFHTPHSLCVDEESRVYLSDRENHWVQVLNSSGELLATWEDVGRPATVRYHSGSIFVLSNLPAARGIVRRFNKDGVLLDVFRTKPRGTQEDFEWPHGLAVSEGGATVYVGFVLTARRIHRYRLKAKL